MPAGRALIFANGKQFDAEAVRELVRPEDFLVAADGGLRHMRRLGLQPHLLIGDLDSAAPDEVSLLREKGIRVLQYPAEKDETDLELALQVTAREGYQTIMVLGGLGGRLDMTLANIFLLMLPELAGKDVSFVDGIESVSLIWPGPGYVIIGRPGDQVSLLPWGGPAAGIWTEGLYYPLKGETLFPERSRGISNLLVVDRASVALETGLLICIHTRGTRG
jgi:thiamine pyrophosphokinase